MGAAAYHQRFHERELTSWQKKVAKRGYTLALVEPITP
jgi:hypothetical protein